MHFSFRLGNEEQQPEVPILYHDVTSLLLIQILMMPQSLHKGMSLQFNLRLYCIYNEYSKNYRHKYNIQSDGNILR